MQSCLHGTEEQTPTEVQSVGVVTPVLDGPQTRIGANSCCAFCALGSYLKFPSGRWSEQGSLQVPSN